MPMYLHKLESDEKHHFLALANHLAKLDDQRVDARERYLIRYMYAEMGLEEDEEIPAFDLDKFKTVFFRPEARRVAVMEGLGVCYANEKPDESQIAMLNELAQTFRLGDDFVQKAEDLVKRQLQMMDEFEALITAE